MTFPASASRPQYGFLLSWEWSFLSSLHGGYLRGFSHSPFSVECIGIHEPCRDTYQPRIQRCRDPKRVYRYFKEGRMNWPLAWNIIVGTVPGLIAGLFIRVWYLPDPRAFKLFVGCVLFYIGGRMLYQLASQRGTNTSEKTAENKMRQHSTAKIAVASNPASRRSGR